MDYPRKQLPIAPQDSKFILSIAPQDSKVGHSLVYLAVLEE